jgi:ATP-dependent Lhr-like helicase
MLDPRIQNWIWSAGWTELRDAQDRAIRAILHGSGDLIIAASTAAGKTEAAFLPILTRLGESDNNSLVLYVSPLKALINDQWRRLDDLTEQLGIPVTPWHGDISQSRKSRFLKKPFGCLLITPESLEAFVMRNGHGLAALLAKLEFIVVDEIHAFIGTERGKQLQSLMHRIETAVGHTVRRIGLSATLGDMRGAAEFFRPGHGPEVFVIESKAAHQELKVLVKGLVEVPQLETSPEIDCGIQVAKVVIARHMFETLRGTSNLVFPNSRGSVEFYADFLRQMSEERGCPNEFWLHHGNLSKEIREETEAALKQTELPATAICTSTLELGIDIGPVKSVVQIGPPPSVASLRQRLGRSGRRKGEAMVLCAYCVEDELSDPAGPSELLREGLICTTAMIRLLAGGWYEPVHANQIHGSTLVQQLLSTLSQYGAARVQALWDILCGRGAFGGLTKEQYLSLLRTLGQKEIIFQDPTGLLLLAPKGEQITAHYSFYAAFSTDEEYRIVTGSHSLGSMPITRPLTTGSFIIFAGRRWEVVEFSQQEKFVDVRPSKGGSVPKFDGGMGFGIHDRVRKEMREILRSSEPVPFLDAGGQRLLQEARKNYARMGLDSTWLLNMGNDVHLMLWCGDKVADTLVLALQARGVFGGNEGLSIHLRNSSEDSVKRALSEIASDADLTAKQLASAVQNKVREKWDELLPADLLDASYASACLDVAGMQQMLKETVCK